jgi:hypothetical protein
MRLVKTLPRGVDFTELFLATWPPLDPNLGRDALAELTDEAQRRGLPPPVDSEEAAARWIWEEDIPLDGPREVGTYSPLGFPRERLMLEIRVREILTALADKSRSGELLLIAIHPKTHEPFRPDPAYLEDLMGSDRSRSRITTAQGPITHVRFEANPTLRKPRAVSKVLEKMRRAGLAAVEAIRYTERGQHYLTSDRTADRALRKLREELAKEPAKKQ